MALNATIYSLDTELADIDRSVYRTMNLRLARQPSETLEYMLMRPLERPVFDATRRWLAESPDEKFLLIVDEAHLYRGEAGAEVALLLRRLRARLGIAADRVQVIATSASFSDVPDSIGTCIAIARRVGRRTDAN